MDYQLYHGDCLDIMPTLPDASVDAIITDPPYPYIKREYGFWTEEDWLPMMQEVVRQSRRILKPTGSMVIILQPNSEKAGSMRLWLWRFMLWAGEYWNIVQDAYWWNYTKMPTGAANKYGKLMRDSVKPCIWIGQPSCYRDQESVRWQPSQATLADNANKRMYHISGGRTMVRSKMVEMIRKNGKVTPFNLLPVPVTDAPDHPAGTPLELCDWWTRYICPSGGVVADWFAGTATTGIAALQNSCGYIGIERFDKYIPVAEQRLKEAKEKHTIQALPLFKPESNQLTLSASGI